MNKRGMEMTLIQFMELVLAGLVVTSLVFAVLRMTDGTAYRRELYAKDNAHVVDAMLTTPNGEMRVAYLWKSNSNALALTANSVAVYTRDSSKIDKAAIDHYSKVFGTHRTASVDPEPLFAPSYYAYVLAPNGANRRLFIDRTFQDITCPASSEAFTGAQVSAQLSGFSQTDTAYAAAVFEGMRLQAGREFSTQGVTILLRARNSPSPDIQIAYNSLNDRTIRLSCFIAQELQRTQPAVTYVHVSQIPPTDQNYDIVIDIASTDDVALSALGEKIAASTKAYTQPTRSP